jgi:hypothetical protein
MGKGAKDADPETSFQDGKEVIKKKDRHGRRSFFFPKEVLN